MENNKTLVSKFVDDFKKLSNDANKQAMVKKHVVTHYAPILHKRNVLDLMMDGCVKQGKSGRYVDLFVSKLNFIGAILILYTDLAVDKTTNSESNEVANIWGAYDLLKESGAMDILLNEIGDDLNELITVQDQILSTWHNEHASTAAYISDLVEKVSIIFSTVMGKQIGSLADVLNTGTDEEKAELVSALMENFRVK